MDLYKGSFSLAYGTLTLLRVTKRLLRRNRFCGLLGPNQCGKTTLMRAIAPCPRSSRVAVNGPNDAGKSTAIKVLIGEQLPTSGSIWKAVGLRLAYVARHGFHHLEKHMQETPTQYIVWFFAGDDERESLELKFDGLSVDEESARSVRWCIDGVTGSVCPCTDPNSDAKKAKADEAGAVDPEATVNHRQKKKEKTFEYEVKT